LAFTAGILLIKLFYERNLKYKIFYILFFLSATTNLFINGGKTGQIIFIVLILITIFSSIKHRLKAFLISTIILTLSFNLAYNFSPNFHNRSNQLYAGITKMITHHDFNGSGGYRTGLSIIGINTFMQNPILGTGIAYSMKNPQVYATNENINITNIQHYADYHNAFITLSVQLGIIGLIISLLIIYALLNFKIQNKEYKILSLLFAIAFIMFSFTHNTLHTMNPMIFFALFAGFFNMISRQQS
jgi:O-antigen ligase